MSFPTQYHLSSQSFKGAATGNGQWSMSMVRQLASNRGRANHCRVTHQACVLPFYRHHSYSARPRQLVAGQIQSVSGGEGPAGQGVCRCPGDRRHRVHLHRAKQNLRGAQNRHVQVWSRRDPAPAPGPVAAVV